MMKFISSFKELQYYLDIKQKCKINLCDISKENGNIGNCKESDLIPTDVFNPKYSVNNCASNNKKVLLVGDSFLTNTSQLYRATFKEVLQVHFNNFYGDKLQE